MKNEKLSKSYVRMTFKGNTPLHPPTTNLVELLRAKLDKRSGTQQDLPAPANSAENFPSIFENYLSILIIHLGLGLGDHARA